MIFSNVVLRNIPDFGGGQGGYIIPLGKFFLIWLNSKKINMCCRKKSICLKQLTFLHFQNPQQVKLILKYCSWFVSLVVIRGRLTDGKFDPGHFSRITV